MTAHLTPSLDATTGSSEVPAAPDEREAWQPELTRPVELTPLPEIERAMPILGIFQVFLGRRHVAVKVGIIRDLASQAGKRWRMREIVQRVDWLKPSSVHKLVHELSQGGAVLHYDPARLTYRLTREARVVASFCGALTVPELKHGRLIKILIAAIRTAQAVGAPDDALFQPFIDAIAIIEEDYEEMRSLIDDKSENALKHAVEAAREHLDDMRDLLEHQDDFFARFQSDIRFLDLVDRAHRALVALAALTDDVYLELFAQTDDLLRHGLTFDRQDIREMVRSLPLAVVAELLPATMASPPMLVPTDTEAFFATLAGYLGRPDVTQGLPEPTVIAVRPSATPRTSDFWVAARELERLVIDGPAPAAAWVATTDWPTAVHRMGALVGAWSHYGPAGSDEMTIDLLAGAGLREVGSGGVAMMSELTVLPGKQSR